MGPEETVDYRMEGNACSQFVACYEAHDGMRAATRPGAACMIAASVTPL